MRRYGISLMEVTLAVVASLTLAAFTASTARHMTNESRMAQAKQILTQMRINIGLYKFRSPTKSPPTLATFNSNTYSYNDSGTTRTGEFYGGGIPPEPFTGSTAVVGTWDGTGGWVYYPSSGTVAVNLDGWQYGPGGSKINLSDYAWDW